LSTGQAARLLVGAACPVLTVPHIGWGTARLVPFQSRTFGRALVAWSDTRESARALRDALLLLARATQVRAASALRCRPWARRGWILGRAAGIAPELLHRVTAIATGGLDALPHNGAAITLLGICGPTHRQSYFDIFVVTVTVPLLALVAMVVLGTAFRSS